MRNVTAMEHPIMAISQDERGFFVALGNRIARLRKENHITQVQLAEALGVSQSAMNAYELGHRRVPLSALSTLAKTLGVGPEELLGETNAATRKRGPAPKLQQHMDRITQLPKPRQRMVMEMLDAVLAQGSR